MKNDTKKNILSLNSKEAREFFLKEEKYFTTKLPPYFTFSELLKNLSDKLDGGNLSDYYKKISNENKKEKSLKPEDFEKVNYLLINNKNGKYAWRPLELIHPALYVSLVHNITSNGNWKIIQKRFNGNSCVECMSIPVVSEGEKYDESEQNIHFLGTVEKKSIELALDYEYIFHTDILHCYGSIYTHSIAWALHTKPIAKKNRSDKLLGNVIDRHLQGMSYGQTNGIPQGSVLMDLVAEIVLSYADELLSDKLSKFEEKDYKILRYRDDYRVFVNNPQVGEEIIKGLSEVLADLGMQLNAQKTSYSKDIINNSIKPDKFYSIVNSEISEDIQRELFNIKDLSMRFPNCKTLYKRLKNISEKILTDESPKYDLQMLISMVVDLALNNSNTYPAASAILGKLIKFLPEKEREDGILKIKNKFESIPNTEYMDLWLQRISILYKFKNIEYEGELCKLANEEPSITIWKSEWLNKKITGIISSTSIIDKEKIKDIIEKQNANIDDEIPDYGLDEYC
ncbi:MAG: RNA-directed DNA polymerase [Pseudomonadota bacterium]